MTKKFQEIQLPTNRKFGFFFAGVFAVIAVYFINEGSSVLAYFFLGLAVIFILISLVLADFLLPLNKLWMRFGLLLGKIVSPIVLGAIFFGLFTPIALFIRIAGRDELRLKIKNSSSFWKLREKNSISSIRFKKQF